MTTLNESGIMRHDLDDLIMPLIDIDTFESKISNSKAVVVAFYCFDQDPAYDLEKFIEHGSVDVLDAETSPAPTEDGYYVVFIELERDQNLPENLIEIINSVDNLTNVEQWQFKTYRDPEIHDLTEDNLREHVNLDPAQVPQGSDDIRSNPEKEEEPGAEEEPDAEEEFSEVLIPLLKDALVESAELDKNVLILQSGSAARRYRVVEVAKSSFSLPILNINIGDPLIGESLRLNRILGPAYQVEVVDDALMVSCSHGCMVLKTLD